MRGQALARSREYTGRILDAFDDLFFVQDAEANLRRWNDSFRRVAGYSDEEIGKMKWDDFIPEDYRDRAAEAIQRVVDEGHARLEAPLLRKDGTTIPYEYVASRVVHPEGTERLVGIGRDISERKALERELEDSRERWRRLVESHQDGIQISIGGEIRYMNPAGARILGADVPAQVVGEPLGRFLGADQKHGAMDERMRRLSKGGSRTSRRSWVFGS